MRVEHGWLIKPLSSLVPYAECVADVRRIERDQDTTDISRMCARVQQQRAKMVPDRLNLAIWVWKKSCLFKYPDLPPGSCCSFRHVSSPAHWSRVWGWYCYPRLSHIKKWAPQRISQCYKQSAEKLPKSIGGSVNHKIWHQPIWSVLRKCLSVLTVMVLCLTRRWLLNAASVSQPAAGRICK